VLASRAVGVRVPSKCRERQHDAAARAAAPRRSGARRRAGHQELARQTSNLLMPQVARKPGGTGNQKPSEWKSPGAEPLTTERTGTEPLEPRPFAEEKRIILGIINENPTITPRTHSVQATTQRMAMAKVRIGEESCRTVITRRRARQDPDFCFV